MNERRVSATTRPSLRRAWRRFRAATGGGIAVWTAVALPPLAVLAVGAVELASVSSDRGVLQLAALAGARELGFSGPGGVVQRTQAYAVEQSADVAGRQRISAAATLQDDDQTVRLEMRAHRMSFFGNLLPPGGFNTVVVSTASALGSTPLCLVGLRTAAGTDVHVYDNARIRATDCLIQSNADVLAAGGAAIAAGEVQASGAASGAITPVPLVGAPVLEDPFASRRIVHDSCGLLGGLLGLLIPAGSHCSDIRLGRGDVKRFAPGVHHFRDADLIMTADSRIEGDGVVLIFDSQSSMRVSGSASLDLQGMRTGAWAGFVIIGPRSNGETFDFASANIDTLEGVIYLPSSLLRVSGNREVAEDSNWTVTLANRMEVRGSTTLVVNSDYAGSNVPVPRGVGPREGGTRLIR